MLISCFRYLKGYVRIRLTGYSPERFLNLCKSHQMTVWDLQNNGLSYEMNISIRDFRRLKPLRKKSRSHIRILERHGLPFFLHRYRKRKMFAVGILLCISFLYCMSLYIWNIHIEGNRTRTTDVILDYLETEQVVHGMRKSQVDCSEIQAMIRIRFPDIIWVSAEIKGTRLLIRVRENMDSISVPKEEAEEPRDIAAAREGIITSILVRQGVSQIQVGDTVEKGSLLVSGRIDILNDAGEVTGFQYVPSDADIYARTTYPYSDKILLSHDEKHLTGKKRYGYYIKLGNKMLSFKRSPKFENYSVLKTETPVRLTENFYLPLTFGSALYEEYEIYTKYYTPEEVKNLAAVRLNAYLEKLIEKGVQIVENNVKIEVNENYCVVSGTIVGLEEISAYQALEILPDPIPETEEGV